MRSVHKAFGNPRRQNGAILVVSLLLLLVLTVLALTASQTTRLQERMAGNARDLDLAFQAGEAGLVAAEDHVLAMPADRGQFVPCADGADVESCHFAGPEFDVEMNDEEWWTDDTREFGEDLAHVNAPPHHYTMEMGRVDDDLTEGGGPPGDAGTIYLRNISRAVGATDTASVILESTYARRWSSN